MSSQLFAVTREEKIACLKRELNYREEVYKRRIAAGKMSVQKANREIEVMRAILLDYEPGGQDAEDR